MSAAQQLYPAAFDAIAERYDDTFTYSRIGQAQRAAVWSELKDLFHPGNRLLEIGCGTGVDACFLAQRGIHVTACDSSSQMVAMTSRRVQQNGLGRFVTPLVLPAEQLSHLHSNERFDGAFSNFGALNCVENLDNLSSDLAALIKPGGVALLCLMSSFCAWETAWYLAHAKTRKAFRRQQHDGVMARLADSAYVHVTYPTVSVLAHAFAPEFKIKSIKGIGVTVPPSYLEPWAQRHPRLLQLCERMDSVLSLCPGVRLLADHVLVKLARVGTTARSTR
jgi:ubiquinone/menaquinone biosynthesis C-methylase UbiE